MSAIPAERYRPGPTTGKSKPVTLLTVGVSTAISAALTFNRVIEVYAIHFEAAVWLNELVGQLHIHPSKIKGSGCFDKPAVRLFLEGGAINRVIWI
jgi:hypothetical protein